MYILVMFATTWLWREKCDNNSEGSQQKVASKDAFIFVCILLQMLGLYTVCVVF